VSDFGGVLTLPLDEAFARAHDEIGIPLEALGKAMRHAAAGGEPPIFKLERGELTDAEFMRIIEASLSHVLGREVSLPGYGERLMAALTVNQPLVDYYRALRDDRGLRLAICTNNVREWQPRWRTAAIDELFELVVDSGFEGTRKPEPRIYAIVLERLGLAAGECVFVDDLELNITGAQEAGMHGVHFRETAQAVAEIDALVGAAA